MRAAAAALLIAIAIAGCGRPAEKPASNANGGVSAGSKVLATVNGEPITDKDLKLFLALQVSKDPSFRITPSSMDEQLQALIDERLGLQHKQRDGSDIKVFRLNAQN